MVYKSLRLILFENLGKKSYPTHSLTFCKIVDLLKKQGIKHKHIFCFSKVVFYTSAFASRSSKLVL